MAGRPSLRSPERETAILNSLRVGNTRTASSAAADISLDTFARWMAKDEEFRGAVQKAEADAELRFLAQVARAAQGGTWQAAAWWLERRRAADYRRQDGVELTGRDGGPIATRDVTNELNDHEAEVLGEIVREELKRRADTETAKPALADSSAAGAATS